MVSPSDHDAPRPEYRRQPGLIAWWRLSRGGNAALAGLVGAVGGWLIHPAQSWPFLVQVGLAPLLITAGGNIQNDLCDIAIDRINQPDRPLPSGSISTFTATGAMWVLFLLGLASAWLLSLPAFTIALTVVLGLSLYNHRLSRTPLYGNILIAFMGALPVVYGAVASRPRLDTRLFVVLAVSAIAFWLHLAREILKDVLDMEGDLLARRRTIPILLGPRAAMRLAAVAMLGGALTTLWPAITGWVGPIYLVGVLCTVVPALLLGAAQCWWREDDAIASTWSFALKLCMLAGLVWIILGTVRS